MKSHLLTWWSRYSDVSLYICPTWLMQRYLWNHKRHSKVAIFKLNPIGILNPYLNKSLLEWSSSLILGQPKIEEPLRIKIFWDLINQSFFQSFQGFPKLIITKKKVIRLKLLNLGTWTAFRSLCTPEWDMQNVWVYVNVFLSREKVNSSWDLQKGL